jgi:hypothetical protein
MARSLIWLVLEYGRTKDWIYVPGSAPPGVLRSREEGKLAWWGLVAEKPNDDAKRKSSGFWKPTRKGVAFVYDRVRVPARAVVYNNKCEGFDGDEIGIREAIGEQFNYEELMSA